MHGFTSSLAHEINDSFHLIVLTIPSPWCSTVLLILLPKNPWVLSDKISYRKNITVNDILLRVAQRKGQSTEVIHIVTYSLQTPSSSVQRYGFMGKQGVGPGKWRWHLWIRGRHLWLKFGCGVTFEGLGSHLRAWWVAVYRSAWQKRNDYCGPHRAYLIITCDKLLSLSSKQGV